MNLDSRGGYSPVVGAEPVFAPYGAGLLLGLALIMPIGAQNVFVVGQGLAVGMPRALWAAVAAACCDTLLILLGAAGMSGLIGAVPAVRTTLLLAGAVFLTYLGVQSFRGSGGRLDGATSAPQPVSVVVRRSVSVSLLNPHAILDTVGVIGAAVVAQPAGSRVAFTVGTVSASWLWFLLLVVVATQVRRFLTPRATVWFDRVSGAIMLGFAVLFTVEFVRAVT